MPSLLMTAGATRNKVDAIRYLSANAGGSTVLDIVKLVWEPGLKVHFLGSSEAILRARLDQAERRLAGRMPWKGVFEEYTGTRDLMGRMERWVKANPDGLILHSAAVGDYELAENTGKIPSGQPEVLLRLTPAPKILDQIRGWGFKGRLVSFKAGRPGLTGEQLEEIARAQALRTGSDLVFANVLGQLQEQVLLVGPEQTLVCERRGQAILGLVEQLRFWLRESLRGAEGP